MMATRPISYAVLRGQVIESDLIEFGGRGGDITFLAPDPHKIASRIPLASPRLMEDLYELSFEQIIDYLGELGPRLALKDNATNRDAPIVARLNDAGIPDRIFPMFRCWGDIRCVDPAIDPSDRKPNWCYRGDPATANRTPSIGRANTIKTWLKAPQGAEPKYRRREMPTKLAPFVEALDKVGGELLITADHGNVEQMQDPQTQQAHTAHTVNPVPLIYVSAPAYQGELKAGRLCDIAPTILKILQIPQPDEMTGESLI